MNPNLEVERMLDDAAARQDQVAQQQRAAEADDAWRKSGLATNGPANYDHVGAYGAGEAFQPAEGGGVNLPNKYIKDLDIAGFDVQTGTNLYNTNDPDGFGQRGYDAFRQSYTNTEQGTPVDATDSIVHLALHHVQNGGTRDDFNVPVKDELKDRAFQYVNQVNGVKGVEMALEQLPADVQPEPVEGEPLTTEMLEADEEFVSDAKLIYDFWDTQSDAQLGDITGEPNYAAAAIEEVAMTFANISKMAELIWDVETGELPPEVAQAYLRVMDKYERVNWYNPRVIGGSVAGVLTDPFTWGSGAVGSLLFKSGGKEAAKQAMKSKLRKVAEGAMVAGGVGAAEGAMFTGTEEATKQALKGDGYNAGAIAGQAGYGALGGAIIGTPIGAILSQPGREQIAKAFHKMADNYAKTTTPRMGSLAAQRGSIDLGEVKPVAGYDPEFKDFGELMASTGRSTPQFYSRLIETTKGNFSKSPAMLMEQLTGMAKKGAFPSYELDDTGLMDFLQAKVDAGEKLTRRELDNFMFARQPRISMAIGSRDSFSGKDPREVSYRTKSPDMIRRDYLIRTIADMEYTFDEVEVEVDGTDAIRMANKYLDDIQAWGEYQRKLELMDAEGVYDEVDMPFKPKNPVMGGGVRNTSMGYADEVEAYGSRMLMAIHKGELFDEPRPKWEPVYTTEVHRTHKETGEVEVYPYMFDAQDDARKAVAPIADRMTDDQMIDYMRRNREEVLMAPPNWSNMKITDGPAENYREMRLFIPYEGMGNPHNVAIERFGKTFEQLGAEERKDVNQIVGFAREAPEEPFREGIHYPLEQNRLAHIRMQDMYAPDGEKVLFIDEMQSDLRNRLMMTPEGRPRDDDAAEAAVEELRGMLSEDMHDILDSLRAFDKDDFEFFDEDLAWWESSEMYGFDNPNADYEYTDEPDIPEDVHLVLEKLRHAFRGESEALVDKRYRVKQLVQTIVQNRKVYGAEEYQPFQGSWAEMSMARIFQYAREQGYGAVSFPRTVEQVAKIEHWPEEKWAEMGGVVSYYTRTIPNIVKKWQKSQGLKAHKAIPLAGESGGEAVGDFYTVQLLPDAPDSSPLKQSRRPIYGAVVGATGVQQMMGEDEENY